MFCLMQRCTLQLLAGFYLSYLSDPAAVLLLTGKVRGHEYLGNGLCHEYGYFRNLYKRADARLPDNAADCGKPRY